MYKMKTNVVMISCDSLRFDKMGCMNKNAPSLTPNIDELGNKGLRFKNHYTVSNGSCPSHASIFTGCYPKTHGIVENGRKIPEKVTTIAQMLQQKNYSTAGAVSAVILDSRYNFNKGFTDFFDTTKYARMHETLLKIGYKKYNASRALSLLRITDGRWRSYDKVNREVLNWIDKKASNPFFLFIHYMDIHGDTYGNKKTVKQKLGNYDENVKIIDRAIKQVIDKLKEKGVYDNTLFVIFSDHGENFGEHGEKAGHGASVSEEEFHTPCIIYKEGLTENKDINQLSRSIDIVPTVLNFLDIEHERMDGKSLIPAIKYGDDVVPEIFLEAYPPFGDVKGLRTKEWKYVLKNQKEEQLFSVEDNVVQKENRVQEYKEYATQYRMKLKKHFNIPYEAAELDELTKTRLRGLGYLD